MGFVDEVQDWLRSLSAEPRRAPAEVPADVDLQAARDVMWEAMGLLTERRVRRVHEEWSRPGFFEAFVGELVAGIRRHVGARWSGERVEQALHATIRAGVIGDEVPSEVVGGLHMSLELGRIAGEARRVAEAMVEAGLRPDLSRWCRAVHLIDNEGRPTPLAQAQLALAGNEALHFLLELEVALSTGSSDDMRVSRRALQDVRDHDLLYDGDPEDPPYATEVIQRLAEAGVLTRHSFGLPIRITVAEDAEALVDAVLDPAPNPYRTLVEALLEAERGRVASTATGQPLPAGADFGYVRMIVHEIRNVALPLSNALSRLWTELEKAGGPDPARVAELRERVDRSMSRIHEFARDSARLATAVAPESFPLREVIDEAASATEADRNGRIRIEQDDVDDALLDGPRARWVLLFVNLMRNAAQVRAGNGLVRITTEWSLAGALHVYVDDDGPGVPAELRERVFEMGVSTRGGTGLGLHEARTTALLSGGTLVCEDAPLGGARFHLQVPARRRG